MDYQGPTPDDLANIRALNRCFLMAVAGSEAEGLGEIAERRLTNSQLSRLAGAPFLLFSFREQDNNYWRRLLSDDPQIDLIELSEPLDERIRQLQMAGLGFIWQLARSNPYASRIISGAPVSWCEQLAGSTLIHLLDQAANRSDLLRVRFQDETWVWRRLLGNGTSAQRHLRQTSHQCALQVLLTRGQASQYDRVSAAACNMRTPATRQAPQHSARIGDTKV
ncbi:MAG: hypothetical protein GY783_07435 [Gammaproteobacteria bacterium]|nr:hypothetical protein [Gammaproteobacteria bacterium]